MTPVVQRIADQLRQSLRPFLEFLPVCSIAGNIFFVYAVGTHLTPFIMVAAQPYLSDVVEFAVLVDFLRIDVAVIIHDRHLLRIVEEV